MHSDYACPDGRFGAAGPVDGDRRAGDEGRAREIEDRLGDVVRRADAPQHRLRGAARLVVSGLERDGPGAIPQTRTSGASAFASVRVSIAWAAFAAQWAANEGHGW